MAETKYTEVATQLADYHDVLRERKLSEGLIHELVAIHARGIANRATN